MNQRSHPAILQINVAVGFALGTGMAWLYSTVIVLAPTVVPEVARQVYFEAAAIIIGLVDLGLVLVRGLVVLVLRAVVVLVVVLSISPLFVSPTNLNTG